MSIKKERDGDEPGSLPVAKQALSQKREVRQLNTRLEMLVRHFKDHSRIQNALKQSLAKQEIEFRNRLKQTEIQNKETIEKLRKENQNLAYDNKRYHQDINNALNSKREYEERLQGSESHAAALTSEIETLKISEARNKDIVNNLRKENASLKYKYGTFESEKKSFTDKLNSYKIKYDEILRSLTAKESQAKSDKETYERLIMDKNDELDKIHKELKSSEIKYNSTRDRLRKEFDSKLAEFVQKREDQYKQEKSEWMRIFKDEFNRKMRTYKEANAELTNNNKKHEADVQELRTRISKLKQIKTELEVQNRNNEEELDKVRSDMDELSRTKDNELKDKNSKIIQLRDQYKAKELQFDELVGLKLQLDSEIELYRNILNEAESNAGYMSPLASSYKTDAGGNKRKRKRIQYTPYDDSSNSKSNGVTTPGITRAAINAQKDIAQSLRSDISEYQQQDDCKDEEEELIDEYTTPGDVEGAALQFSSLDLNTGMIEVKNFGEHNIDLTGYALSNKSGDALFNLPKKILKSKQTLRVFIGETLLKSMPIDSDDDDEELEAPKSHKKIIGSYKGEYVFWPRDVWTGNSVDCARLYNPNNNEVAKIEISPDMLASRNDKSCLIM